MSRQEQPTTATQAMQTTFLGYAVEKLADDRGRRFQPAYYLRGPRGAQYALIRNQNRPHMLFAISARTGNVVALKGNSWFSDKTGVLAPCN